jgi:hypothetical protein
MKTASCREIEQLLVAVWEPLLGGRSVDANTNVFEVGASSLMVALVCAELRQRLELEVSEVDIYLHPSVADLAGLVMQLLSAKEGGG